VAIAPGGAPLGSSPATVAADAAAGRAGGRDAAGRRSADVCWLGEDTASADAPAWLSLQSAECLVEIVVRRQISRRG
jgi:hypothetical protein